MIAINNSEEQPLEIGSIVEGTISGITSFGAFVKLPGRVEGLIHISEIANEYVTNIENYVSLGNTVKIKVLGLNKKNKYDLSLKQANTDTQKGTDDSRKVGMNSSNNKMVGKYRKVDKDTLNPFEEKIMDFLKRSEEKQIDLKKNIQLKQGVKKRKKK
ncbi:MAG: S1 RNA-binding domain-containing protein [Candidatus Margulisbacteria bacterium]|nr:S1 RNA-binding domain-containing protein [Candidatus Margulisiibacteriota bacterium]